MELSEIQKKVYKEYCDNGYSLFWKAESFKETKKSCIAELGFITTEIAEAIETIFKSNGIPNSQLEIELGLECADILIRTLNFMSRLNLDAEKYIDMKNIINSNRGYLHGKTKEQY